MLYPVELQVQSLIQKGVTDISRHRVQRLPHPSQYAKPPRISSTSRSSAMRQTNGRKNPGKVVLFRHRRRNRPYEVYERARRPASGVVVQFGEGEAPAEPYS